MTPDEIRDLDAYCHERFIELVPNQNSFGHMHRWLVHDPYRELAECPDGIDHPFARAREPFSLCATDERSFDLLADLYDQLLPNFRSRSINVGLDETLDLGKGRSREACAARGTTAVYLEYLTRVHRLLTERGYRMQFWGDIALAEPDSADGLSEQALEPGALPRDAVALIWGYEADHPFELQCQKMKATGLEYWVCPGTSNWNSLAGRLDEAISNITHAARAGRLEGASGLLLTDWGDFGHLQPPAVSWPGYLTASERSWNADGKRVLDDDTMTALLAQWGFPSDSVAPQERVELASVLMQLARVYRSTGARHRNGSALFYLLIFPDAKLDHPRFAGLDDEALAEARAVITRALAELPDSGLVARELRWVGQALDLAARLGSARIAAGGATVAELPRAVASTLDRDLRTLCRELPALWRERSREGGLKASLEWLESLARELSC